MNETSKVILNIIANSAEVPSLLENLNYNDWRRIEFTAKDQGIRALLYSRLRSLGLTRVIPSGIAQGFREAYITSTGKNINFLAELGKIVDEFHAANIPLIVLKGCDLVQRVYSDIGCREMNDLDVLVPKEKIVPAAEILLGMGFHFINGKKLEDISIYYHNHLPGLVKNGVLLEVHWSIAYNNVSDGLQMTDLWNTAIPFDGVNHNQLFLSPEYLLLHQCYHNAIHHDFSFGIRPYSDIHEIIRKFGDTIDWEFFCDRVNECGWANGIGATLKLTHNYFGIEIPQVVWNSLNRLESDKYVLLAEKLTFNDHLYLAHQLTPNVDEIMNDHIIRTGKIIISRFFPSRFEMAQMYHLPINSITLYLAYPKRWIYLIKQYFNLIVGLQMNRDNVREITENKYKLHQWVRQSFE